MDNNREQDKTLAELQSRLQSMRSVKFPDADYYCFTLTATRDGEIQWGTQSVFAGSTDTQPRRELRAASKVNPVKMLDLLTSVGDPCLVVNEKLDFFLYLHLGGRVIIRADIAEQYLPELLEPKEAVR
jgi:hypothetical protein